MASLLTKFRIDYQSLKMVSAMTEAPQPETVNFFNKLVEGFSEENVTDPGKRNIATDTINTTHSRIA
jgi:methionine-rich copper-binding protein CopC